MLSLYVGWGSGLKWWPGIIASWLYVSLVLAAFLWWWSTLQAMGWPWRRLTKTCVDRICRFGKRLVWWRR
jgi:hypothetical protein